MGTAGTGSENVTFEPADFDRFRLRSFVERLSNTGELDRHEAAIDLADVAARLEGTSRAVLFSQVGPEGQELVGREL